ncbi:MAG: hypothetical protein IJZ53_13755 [Tyzzerella sp.]|nr:hypothetical protein [Tyzzerella sp.]
MNNKYKPIVFVNNPISDSGEDVIGFQSQVDIIRSAINKGANMIGVIADYGTGKTSMTNLLCNEIQNDKNPKPIKVNMWDCLSSQTGKELNENVSNLTKSFLYQLANGHASKFGRYINKILSKNYGNISFSVNNLVWFVVWFIIAGVSYTLYKVANVSGTGVMQFLPKWCDIAVAFFKAISPVFVLIAGIAVFLGVKDVCIAFSHWKMLGKSEIQISDVFDTYSMIIEKIKPKKGKQLVFIDDLDRINEKEVMIEFLKEIYRFQDSLVEDCSKFVFVISIKPESELKQLEDDKEVDYVYTKVFDIIVSLKPIHFDDYDSILLRLIKSDASSKIALQNLIGIKVEDVLPESFKWIKKGTNLTLRDLKERLNKAIAIMVSLKNQEYKVNTAVNFEACTAISYLENQFSKDYYALIKDEKAFAEFMQRSYKIVNEANQQEDIDELIQAFNECLGKGNYSEKFVLDLCDMVFNGIFNDDFRMYFYTYPKGSHIKTTEERALCDWLLFPNQNMSYEKLDYNVERAYYDGENRTIKQTLGTLETFPPVVLMNDILFVEAAVVSMDKLFEAFLKKMIGIEKGLGEAVCIWDRINTLKEKRTEFINKCITRIISLSETEENIIQERINIIKGVKFDLLEFTDVFVNDGAPQISEEEIEEIRSPLTAIKLVNLKKLEESQAQYLCKVVNAISPTDFTQVENICWKIMQFFAENIEPVDIGEEILCFMQNNMICNDGFFEVVGESEVSQDRIADYLNLFKPTDFSKDYMKAIDNMGFERYISEEIVMTLLEQKLFYTAILYLVNNNKLKMLNPYIGNFEEILGACKKLNDRYPNILVAFRTYFALEMQKEEYRQLFFGEYPLVTEKEFDMSSDISEGVVLINPLKITSENLTEVLALIYRKVNTAEDVLTVFDNLLNKEREICVVDEDVRTKFVEDFEFNRVDMKILSNEQRSHLYSVIEEECEVNNGEKAIQLTKHIGCFIPEVEELIKSDYEDSVKYTEVVRDIDELTDIYLARLDKYHVTIGLSEHLCQELHKRKYYKDYIVADSLRKQDMIIDKRIPFSDYVYVYIRIDRMFDIMSNHWEFLERLQQEADISKLSEKHVVPIFKVSQHKRFFEYIFKEQTDIEIKKKYLNEFGKFATEQDSIAFQKLICEPKNMELLGSKTLYYRVYGQLWESNPYHKGVFTRKWNEIWKNKAS